MGSLISTIYQSSEKIEEISDDEFVDADDGLKITNAMLACSELQEHLMTDAIQSKYSHSHINTSKITFEDVATIEKKLDFYEKVSLLFLLTEQVDYALQASLIEWDNLKQGSSINVLFKWARSKHTSSSSWQDKFVEALCVIQNYAVTRELGFSRENLIEHFLPSQPCTSIHLDLTRKALYCFCDQLSIADTKKLLTNLESDFEKKSFLFQHYGEKYLELYLLHCFSVKYITNTNLSNLISVLKTTGLTQKVEMLESIPNYTSPKTITQNTNIFEKSISEGPKTNCEFDLTKQTKNYAKPTQVNCSENSVIGDNSIVNQVNSTLVYDINPEHVGICLIINQKKFHRGQPKGENLFAEMQYLEIPKHDLQERHGTDCDKESLSDTFKKFGFRIVILDDQTHDCIIPKIEETMQMFSEKDSCFVVCILSHGVENKIYGADSVPVNIDDIVETLHDRKYKFLLGKPKVLIIQSCQGSDLQKVVSAQVSSGNTTDGPSTEKFNVIYDSSGVPEKRDLLIGMSTILGYASIRNEVKGSWYIQELCQVINEQCEVDHLTDILTIVNNRVSQKYWKKEEYGDVTMVPEIRSTLSKKLFFKNLRNLKKPVT